MDKMLKVGDTVLWRGGFGRDAGQPAKVVNMEVCEMPRSKYGDTAMEVEWSRKEYAVVTLNNGHWAYGEQLSPLD